jgi:hypothetical protein
VPSGPRLPRSFRFYSYFLLAAGAFGLALSWTFFPPSWSVALVLLAVGTVLSEAFCVLLPPYSFSLAYPLVVAAFVYGGPSAGAVVAIVSSVTLGDFRERMPLHVMVGNLGLLPLAATLGGWSYVALGGRPLGQGSGAPLSALDFPMILVPLSAAALVSGLGSDALVAVGMASKQQRPIAEVAGVLFWHTPSQIALAIVGYFIAQVLAINVLALPLFIAPFVVASQLYQRYARMQGAYADTIRSLIGALEAKDPYTRGHSERVSTYATQLGKAIGFDRRALERLEYAALLHDLGKLAVPRAVLTKPARLEPEEFDQIKEHPGRGADMVRGIPPLRDLEEAVRQHHERVDGSGYPTGAEGTSMSPASKVLAVADCYDAMTSTRAYRSALTREQAVSELLAGAGTQFDSEVVRCFIENDIGLEGVPERCETVARLEGLPEPAGQGR